MHDEPRRGEHGPRTDNGALRRGAPPDVSAEEMRLAGARIRTVRRARGLTQEELAMATGVSRSAVAQWETGRAGCGGRLRVIAAALDVPLRELQTPARAAAAARAPVEDRAITASEQEFVRLLRLLDGDDQACLFQLARRLAMPSVIDGSGSEALPSSLRSGAERRLARSVR